MKKMLSVFCAIAAACCMLALAGCANDDPTPEDTLSLTQVRTTVNAVFSDLIGEEFSLNTSVSQSAVNLFVSAASEETNNENDILSMIDNDFRMQTIGYYAVPTVFINLDVEENKIYSDSLDKGLPFSYGDFFNVEAVWYRVHQKKIFIYAAFEEGYKDNKEQFKGTIQISIDYNFSNGNYASQAIVASTSYYLVDTGHTQPYTYYHNIETAKENGKIVKFDTTKFWKYVNNVSVPNLTMSDVNDFRSVYAALDEYTDNFDDLEKLERAKSVLINDTELNQIRNRNFPNVTEYTGMLQILYDYAQNFI